MADYATSEEIRMKAGFNNAANLDDAYVVAARRDAQSMIDSALSKSFTVPFSEPIPAIIRTLTIEIAALLLKRQFGMGKFEAEMKELQKQLEGLDSIEGADGELSTSEGVTGYFGESDRMFTVDQEF